MDSAGRVLCGCRDTPRPSPAGPAPPSSAPALKGAGGGGGSHPIPGGTLAWPWGQGFGTAPSPPHTTQTPTSHCSMLASWRMGTNHHRVIHDTGSLPHASAGLRGVRWVHGAAFFLGVLGSVCSLRLPASKVAAFLGSRHRDSPSSASCFRPHVSPASSPPASLL